MPRKDIHMDIDYLVSNTVHDFLPALFNVTF
jgi:hypothetical protein